MDICLLDLYAHNSLKQPATDLSSHQFHTADRRAGKPAAWHGASPSPGQWHQVPWSQRACPPVDNRGPV